MRKLFSGIAAMFLVLIFFSTGVHAKQLTYDEVVYMVDQTDAQINQEIEKAVKEVDELILKYEKKLAIAQKAGDAKLLKDHIKVAKKELNMLADVYKTARTSSALSDRISDLNNRLDNMSNSVEIKSNLAPMYYNYLTWQFNKELDGIIKRLVTVTNKMAEKLIKEAAKSGFTIESEWIEVEIGGRLVLVDPCRVVGP